MQTKTKTLISIIIIVVVIIVVALFLFFNSHLFRNQSTLSNNFSIDNLFGESPAQNSTSTSSTTLISSGISSGAVSNTSIKGIYSLLSTNKGIPSDIINNSNISGISVSQNWADFEQSKGSYNWSDLDQGVSAAKGANKKVLLRLLSGGRNTPAWVLSGVQTFTFTDLNEYHGESFGNNVTVPVFWDPVFLAEKKQLIIDAGKHFANSDIDIVAASCANASSNDWNTNSKDQIYYDQWLKLGFTPEKLINACEQIIDTTATSFPNSVIAMPAKTSGLMDPTPGYIAKAVINYGNSKYPGRVIASDNGLAANTADPLTHPNLGQEGTLIRSLSPNVAGQMLWFVTDDPTCRMNGMKTPCNEASMLSQAINTGINYGMQFIEVYAKDVENPDLQDILKAGETKLLSTK